MKIFWSRIKHDFLLACDRLNLALHWYLRRSLSLPLFRCLIWISYLYLQCYMDSASLHDTLMPLLWVSHAQQQLQLQSMFAILGLFLSFHPTLRLQKIKKSVRHSKTKITRAVLVFATERKNNVVPRLRSQKKVNKVQLFFAK